MFSCAGIMGGTALITRCGRPARPISALAASTWTVLRQDMAFFATGAGRDRRVHLKTLADVDFGWRLQVRWAKASSACAAVVSDLVVAFYFGGHGVPGLSRGGTPHGLRRLRNHARVRAPRRTAPRGSFLTWRGFNVAFAAAMLWRDARSPARR